MEIIKKLLILAAIALSITLVFPDVIPSTTATTVEAATIKISKSKVSLIKGKSETLKVNGTSSKIKWTTSNKKIVKVNNKGKVTAVSKGTATITAKVNGKNYKCKVTVETPSISYTTLTLIKGDSQTLKVTGTKQKITWSTSNKKIATVSSKGKIKAVKNGNVKITAKVGGKTYTCKVRVETPSISKTSLSLTLGESGYIYITGTNQNILWSSRNESVATVESGKINTKSVGSTTIVAKVGSKTYECKVTVNPVPIKTYTSGDYQVGVDIPAGEYVVFANSKYAYFAINSDSSGLTSSIIANDNFAYNSIVTVSRGQYLKLSLCYAVALNDASVNTSGEGMFLVGKHIKAGEYQLQATNARGYYKVYSESTHTSDKRIINDNFTGTKYITVENGQYLQLYGCKIIN